MKFIDEKSMERLGYKNLLSRVEVLSPYGKDKLNKLKFYIQGEEEKLEEEFNIMEKVKKYIETYPNVLLDIESKLHCLKDIRNILKSNILLDVVDLAEIKVQIMTITELSLIIEEHKNIFSYFIMENLTDIIKKLDPRSENTKTFYIYDEYLDDLKIIRNKKKEIESKIYSESNLENIQKLKDERLEAVVIEEKLESLVRKELSSYISINSIKILKCIEKMAELDLILAKIKFAQEYNGVKPVVSRDRKIKLVGMVNIELKEILERENKEYTGIDIELEDGVTVITGANMGGKSVALNTITENILLFHQGFYPFGISATIPLFNFVFFVSDDMQDISKGLSTFGSEIIKLKEVNAFIKQADGFIVFDEFARGTNPKEGQKFVKALIKYLDTKTSTSLITTHFDGVIEENTAHYQVIGLKNINFNELKNKILGRLNSIEVIQEYMDFRLEKVKNRKVPEDALNIAKLIGLDKEISSIIEKEYNKEDLLDE